MFSNRLITISVFIGLTFLLFTSVSEYSSHEKAYYYGTNYDDDTTVYHTPEVQPMYVGGDVALQQFVKRTVRYPEKAIMDGEQGKVFVQFVVEKDGSLTNFAINKSVSNSLDEEALRVAKLMQKWKPGLVNGAPVRSLVIYPIVFRLG